MSDHAPLSPASPRNAMGPRRKAMFPALCTWLLAALLLLMSSDPAAAQSPVPVPPDVAAPSPTPHEHGAEPTPASTTALPSPLPGSPGSHTSEEAGAASPDAAPSRVPKAASSPLPGNLLPPVPSARPSRVPTAVPMASPAPAPPRPLQPGAADGSPREASSTRVPVIVDDVEIITVGGGGDLTAEERAALLRERLEVVLTRVVEPPSVTVTMLGQNPVLQCEGIHIVTVTDADAAREAEPLAVAAVMWRDTVERGLRKVWRERSGGNLGRSFLLCLLFVASGALLHFLGGKASRRYLREPGWLLQGFIWSCVVTACLSLFPNTRGLGEFVHAWLVTPLLRVLVVVGLCLAGWSLARSLTRRYFEALVSLRSDPSHPDTRGAQRVETVHRAVGVFLNIVTAAFMVTGVLLAVHINPATLIASAGVIGVAVGVAAQDMLKDWTAGFAIIFEDQFGVGDVIVSGTHSGTVVAFTLRATQIRNMEGSLVTIPNGSMRVVENQSNQWSQIDLRVNVDYATPNPRLALGIMEEVARELREAEPALILEDPELLGVDQVTDTTIVLRMLLKTAPQMQYSVRRRLLEQIKQRFDAAGIRPPASRVCLSEGPSSPAENDATRG